MFCIKCGKKLHQDYKYLACSDCFTSEQEQKVKPPEYIGGAASSGYTYISYGVSGMTGVYGMTGMSGMTGITGYPNTPKNDDKSEEYKKKLIVEEIENPYYAKAKRLLRPVDEINEMNKKEDMKTGGQDAI